MDSVKNFKYNSSQQPMFSVIETTLNSASFPQNNSAFKDLSFSSYLKPKNTTQNSQENEIGSTTDDTEISIFDAQKYFSESNDPKDVKKQQQQQQQPQQEASHDLITIPRQSSVSSTDGYRRNFRTRSFNATPTASSEASWNSQTGLLVNPPGSIGVSLKNFPSDNCEKRSSGAKKWFLSRKSCCIGKNCIQVKEVTSDSENTGPVLISIDKNNNNAKDNLVDPIHKEKATPTMSSHRSSMTNEVIKIHQQKLAMAPNPLGLSPENNLASIQAPRQQRISASGRPFIDGVAGFSFPILNSSSQATKPALKDIKTKPNIIPIEDPPRKSLEIFQAMLELSSVLRPENPSNGRTNFNPGSPIASVTNMDDDMCSDASSDLFEIESLSTPTSYPMYRRGDSLEETPAFNARRFASAQGINVNNNIQFDMRSLDEPPTPSVAATECYAPSEVSIDWSVTTAEGFDKASVTNFSVSASELGNVAFLRQRLQQQEEAVGDGGKRKGNGLLLMGCRQEKAVSVGPQPVKCVAEGPPIFPLHVGGRPPRTNKPPLGSSNAARLSLAFAA